MILPFVLRHSETCLSRRVSSCRFLGISAISCYNLGTYQLCDGTCTLTFEPAHILVCMFVFMLLRHVLTIVVQVTLPHMEFRSLSQLEEEVS